MGENGFTTQLLHGGSLDPTAQEFRPAYPSSPVPTTVTGTEYHHFPFVPHNHNQAQLVFYPYNTPYSPPYPHQQHQFLYGPNHSSLPFSSSGGDIVPSPSPLPLPLPRLPPPSTSPTRALLLSAVPAKDASESCIRRELEVFGDVRAVQMERVREGIVVVHFYDLRASLAALEEIRGQHMQQQARLRAYYYNYADSPASSRSPCPPAGARGLVLGTAVWAQFMVPAVNAFPDGHNQGTLVVFNLDPQVSKGTLRTIFESFGPVKDVRDIPSRRHQRFVEYFDVRDAAAALPATNGGEICGKQVVVEFSRPTNGGAKRFPHHQYHNSGYHHHEPPSVLRSSGRVYRRGGGPVNNAPPRALVVSSSHQQQQQRQTIPNNYYNSNPNFKKGNSVGCSRRNSSSFTNSSSSSCISTVVVMGRSSPTSSSSNLAGQMSELALVDQQTGTSIISSDHDHQVNEKTKLSSDNRSSLVINGGDGSSACLDRSGSGSSSSSLGAAAAVVITKPREAAGNKQLPLPWRGQKRGLDPRFLIKDDAVDAGSSRDTRTTVMIKNIPNKYSQKLLLNMLDNHCIHCNEQILSSSQQAQAEGAAANSDGDLLPPLSSYDFVYLPIDFNNKCNVGYGFVNMTSPEATLRLYKAFHHQHWEVFNSRKICEVTYARVQGLEALKEHFKNSKFACENEEYLPVVFWPPRDGKDKLTSPHPIAPCSSCHVSTTTASASASEEEEGELSSSEGGGDQYSTTTTTTVLSQPSSDDNGDDFDEGNGVVVDAEINH